MTGDYAGVMRLPGSTGSECRFGVAKNHVVAVVGEPLREIAAEIWPPTFLPADGLAHGERFTEEDGSEGERFDGRLYDVRVLDVVRTRYPRVTWTPMSLPAGDGVTTADLALFGCVDGECVAVVAACKQEGGSS